MGLHLKQRFVAYTVPLLFIFTAIIISYLTILKLIFIERRPLDVLSYNKWSGKAFGNFWLFFGPVSSGRDKEAVSRLLKEVKGIVLDFGPGSGNTLKHLDPSKIERAYGVEPNAHLHEALRAEIKRCGLEGKYIIVGCGAEAEEQMRESGILPESADTIICVKVLCSVPNPQDVIKNLYRMLKPGGTFLVYEHVANRHNIFAMYLQAAYQLIWPCLMGCNLDRQTEDYLKAAGEWQRIELEKKKGELGFETLPHIEGRLIKAGGGPQLN